MLHLIRIPLDKIKTIILFNIPQIRVIYRIKKLTFLRTGKVFSRILKAEFLNNSELPGLGRNPIRNIPIRIRGTGT
jgi:hypothetical protein